VDFLFALAIVVGFVYLIGRVHKLTEKTIELESALRNLRQLVMSDQDLGFDSSPDDKAYRLPSSRLMTHRSIFQNRFSRPPLL